MAAKRLQVKQKPTFRRRRGRVWPPAPDAAKRPAMTIEIIAPADCRTMREVRAGVDSLDRRLVELLAERFGYMDAAARIKGERAAVRDEARKAEVIANAAAHAAELGVPVTLVADVWEQLVEASIAYEFDRFDEIRAGV